MLLAMKWMLDKDEEDNFIEQLDDDYSMMGFEDKCKMFLAMTKEGLDSLTVEQRTKISILTDSIYFLDVCDYDIVDDLVFKWKAEIEMRIAEENYTAESLGIASNQIITNTDIDEFSETDILINESPKKAVKLLNALQKKWGNIPFVCYLELKNIENQKSKEYKKKYL
jgi:hypothetical protein